MADTKISALSSAGTLTGAEVVPVVQSGGNFKLALSTLLTWITAALLTAKRLIPDGGSSGQYLRREGIDGDLGWSSAGLVPDSSVTGYVLTQQSGTAGDYAFAAPALTPAAGSGGQLQYNDGANNFAGAANAGIGASGSLDLTVDTAPAVPSSGAVGLYCAASGGGATLAWVESNGRVQRTAARARRKAYTASVVGSATLQHLGLAAVLVGTASAVTPDTSAAPASALVRVLYSTASGAGSSAGLRYPGLYLYRGADASSGGFIWRGVWVAADPAPVAQRRCFVGLLAATGGFGTVNPSTKTNIFGVGADSGDTDLQIIHNDGSGTATKIALTGFAQADLSAVYSAELWCAPGEAGLHYRVTKFAAGGAPVVQEGYVTSDIPDDEVGLTHHMIVDNGSTALVAAMGIAYIEAERDV